MRLTQLLSGLVDVSEQVLQELDAAEISALALDSRKVAKGSLFIALAGSKQHGLVHAEEVIQNGAGAILFQPSEEGLKLASSITRLPVVPVENLSKVLSRLAARFYGKPSESLNVIGITGTNGKTSCSQFLGQLLDDCGIIGTLGWGDWGELKQTVNTTPDALTVQQVLAEFVKEKKQAVAIEVSSHGLDQGRVNGVRFKGAVYTNISRDHLDYHCTMEAYLLAKLKLLTMPGLEFVVVNLDDAMSGEIMAAVPSSVVIWTVSAKGKGNSLERSVIAENVKHGLEGIEFKVTWGGESLQITAPVYGDFNSENLLCVLAVMLALGNKLTDVAVRFSRLKPVTGRMERCSRALNAPNVFIDYAHTPDALQRVLASLRSHCQQNLWVVFGCGGNRDKGKRPIMGEVAERWSDKVVITDDNPRFENNVQIAKEILAGCHKNKTVLIQDRKTAIQQVIAEAEQDDFVLIAGKGHENYQEIDGVQYPFNDKQIAEEALKIRYAMR